MKEDYRGIGKAEGHWVRWAVTCSASCNYISELMGLVLCNLFRIYNTVLKREYLIANSGDMTFCLTDSFSSREMRKCKQLRRSMHFTLQWAVSKELCCFIHKHLLLFRESIHVILFY